jgi:hypothetical protein
MGAREARRHDDGRNDPDNPIVPFRMSDRLTMVKLQWWLAGLTFLIASGMLLSIGIR